MILHSQDKPFKCTYCEEHFKSRFARLKHQEKFHLGKQINFPRSSIATVGGHVMLEEAAAVESLGEGGHVCGEGYWICCCSWR